MNAPLKIGIDVRDLKLATTGTKTYLSEFLLASHKNNRSDIQIFEISSIWKPYWGHSLIGKIYEHVQFLIWKQLTLPVKSFMMGVDVLICTDYYLPLLKFKAKHMVVFHDALFFDHPEYYNPLWLKWFKFWALKAAYKADAIIVPSVFSKQRISTHLTNLTSKLYVIYQGPKSVAVSNTPTENTAQLLKSLDKEQYILHVGGLEKRKNLSQLIRAVGMVRNEVSIKIVFVGRPNPKIYNNSKKEIEICIEECSMKDSVIFTGYLPDHDLTHIYSKATAYIIPSRYEGFGIPILEAFQHNIPVAVANNTCMPEIGKDAVLTFSPDDDEELSRTLLKIINQADVRNMLIEKGKKRLEFFNWQHSANEIASLAILINK